MAEVKVGGTWLHWHGDVSGISWQSRWGSGPCGDDLAGCTFAVDPAHDTSTLRVGSSFEVYSGGVRVFGGVVDQVSRDFPRKVDAKGYGRRAEDFEALSFDSPTSNPRFAVSGAISRGLPWSNELAFASASIGESGDSVRRLDSLLTEWADKTGKRWGVDSYGRAFAVAEPTTPTLTMDAAGLDIGVTEDGLYTHVVARYISSVDGDGNPNGYGTVVASDSQAEALYGRRENSLDLTRLGQISSGTATTYATAELALGLRPRWLQRVTVSTGGLRSLGGLPVDLSTVRAGQVLRLMNVPTNIGGTRYSVALDVVLGEVSYSTEEPSQVTIAPTNLAVRTLADAIAASRR